MQVSVVYSPRAREVWAETLNLPDGAVLRDALLGTPWGVALLDANGGLPGITAGIWGRKAQWDTALREGDRVEVYRPLQVDPKVARRERFARQGTRSAGLFARQRPGGKAGY